jgi:hypothetical protein
MFELSNWLAAGIVNGYETGAFPFARVTEITAAYLSKGLISAAQAQEIALACPVPAEPEETAPEPMPEESEETI